MRARPVLALTASLALVAGAVSGPVSAAVGEPADAPAAGAATSGLTLLDVALGGRSLSVLELALRSDTLAGAPATSFVVTPLELDGTTYGRQSLKSRSGALPSVDTRAVAPAALSALAAIRTPAVDVTSDGGGSSATTRSLGTISVLGLPLAGDGEISISSAVDGAAAAGTKTLRVENLALPSLADLVAALGLDLTVLPTDSLADLLEGLDLGSTSTDAALALLESALAPVQAQLAPAEAALVDATGAVEGATAELADATAALAPVTKALNDAVQGLTGTTAGGTAGLRMGRLLGGLPDVGGVLDPVVDPIEEVVDPVVQPVEDVLGPVTQPVTDLVDEVDTVLDEADPVLDGVLDPVTDAVDPVVSPVVTPVVEVLGPLPALPVTVPAELQPLVDVYEAAKAAYDTALQDVTDAQNLLTAATQLLADAQTAVDALLAPFAPQIQAVVDAVLAVLDSTPLVSLDRLEVTTRSAVTSAAAGGQTAEVVGGEVEGLRVLGTDVLDEVLGSSALDVVDLTAPLQSRLNSAVSGLTGSLSDVLSAVPGLPGLEVPAPTVSLLSRATVTEVVDGFGVAGSALRALSVSWPGLTVPAAAALPGAGSLPSVTGVPTLPSLSGALRTSAVGDLVTQPLTLSIATLEERARFRPALLSAAPGTGTPGTGTPGTGTPGTGTPGTGTPTTGTPTTGTPTTGTPTTGTPTTATPRTGSPPTTPVGLTQLPRTGPGDAPALLGLLLVAAAIGLQRRHRAA